MEGREKVLERDNLKEPDCKKLEYMIDGSIDDIKHFVRERNLLLLSALYKLYGEEWKHPPDWSKVASEIENAKIPVFGENFTPESCELQYKTFFEKGYQMGLPSTSTNFKTPKRLTEAQKRQWILATTSTDLVVTSKILDAEMRTLYKDELDEIEKLSSSNLDILPHEFAKQLELDGITDLDVACDEEEEYEDLDTQEAAVEVSQIETNELIVGFKDVLLLNKYCVDAVENAVSKFTSLMSLRKKKQPPVSLETSVVKPEIIIELTKSSISTNEVTQELSNIVHSVTAKVVEDGALKNTSPTVLTIFKASTAPELSKLLEPSASSPGKPDIPSLKQNEASPNKQPLAKVSCKGNGKEEINPESTKEPSTSTEEELSSGIEEQPTPPLPCTSPARSPLPVLDTNGKDSTTDTADSVLMEKSPSKSEPDTEHSIVEDAQSKPDKPIVEAELPPVCNDDVKNIPSTVISDEVFPGEDVTNTTVSEFQEVYELSDTTTRLESPTKGKQVGRKGSAARPVTTRTTSRLVSPEPNEQPTKEEEKNIKKTPTRPTASESHTPVLRSRRGATPTKPMATENDTVKNSPITNSSKLDFTEEDDDDTFATPRSSPESPEVLEVAHETKPPKQLKVYSAKLPSPLSHVDRLFSEFIDDEDPELSMIDNNIKSKSDKTLLKSGTKRGRTVSSENASEVGNNDDNGQNKRVNRKIGFSDDADELENSNMDDGSSKRLTRSSLKLHDAANEEGTEAPQTESDKAASESSFSGKEKKPRTSKSMSRLKNLQEEISRVYGDGDDTSEGRLTRARAKTTVPLPEKRSKPPSVGDSEGLSESEPIPSRSTRSRSTTTSSMPVLEPTTSQQLPVVEDEEQKAFRKNALALMEKIVSSDVATQLLKHLQEDPSKILKRSYDFLAIKNKIENGKAKTTASLYVDLITLATNAIMAQPTSSQVKENVALYSKLLKTAVDDFKNQLTPSVQKNDNSDVESLESHDEQRSESSSKQTGGAARRKRKRSTSETSEEVVLQENKRRVTRTSTSTTYQQGGRKTKHPISPDIVSANRSRH